MMGYLFPVTLFFMILYWFICISVFTLMLISVWKIYKKMGAPGWKGIIPVYNMWVMIRLLGKPTRWFWILMGSVVGILLSSFVVGFMVVSSPYDTPFGLFFPGILMLAFTVVAIVYEVKIYIALSKSFGYDPLFLIVLVIIPIVYYVMIAFGGHEFIRPEPKQVPTPLPTLDPEEPVVLEEEFIPKVELPQREDEPKETE